MVVGVAGVMVGCQVLVAALMVACFQIVFGAPRFLFLFEDFLAFFLHSSSGQPYFMLQMLDRWRLPTMTPALSLD